MSTIRSSNTYDYTVETLLEAAERTGSSHVSNPELPSQHNDHVVELQLIVAALNRVQFETYTNPGWQQCLVDFFDQPANIQELTPEENRQKWHSIQATIRGDQLKYEDLMWLEQVSSKWAQLIDLLEGFDEFKGKLDFIITMPLSTVSNLRSWPFHR